MTRRPRSLGGRVRVASRAVPRAAFRPISTNTPAELPPDPAIGSSFAATFVAPSGIIFVRPLGGGPSRSYVFDDRSAGGAWSEQLAGALDGFGRVCWDGEKAIYLGSNSGVLNTLAWNGSDWVDVTTGNEPSIRYTAGMAFDPINENVVMFGGHVGTTSYQDTYTWDGDDWTHEAPATVPTIRSYTRLAWDGTQIIMFGGFPTTGAGGPAKNDTWGWDGTDWTNLAPATTPPARGGQLLEWDGATGCVMGFGFGNGSPAQLSDTYTWDGTDWTDAAPATLPFGGAANIGQTDFDGAWTGYGVFIGINGDWLSGAPFSPFARWDGTDWIVWDDGAFL